MKGRHTPDLHTLELFAAPPQAPETLADTAPVVDGPAMLQALERLADVGLLRRLDSALAAFVWEQDPQADVTLLFATAVLAQMEGRGHSCLPLRDLFDTPNAVLAWSTAAEPVQTALFNELPPLFSFWCKAIRRSPVVRVVGGDEEVADIGQPLVLLDGPAPLLYLRRYWDYERHVAAQIAQRASTSDAEVDTAQAHHWLQRLFAPRTGSGHAQSTDGGTDWQQMACALALRGRMSVITGGPGTGKTYTAARLLALLFAMAPDAQQLRVAMAAPTGKAAARLKQSIDTALLELADTLRDTLNLEDLVKRMGAARTLHALLGARPDTRRFAHHAGHPLDVDVLIVDEASMIHLEMMEALLQALPPTARLILLGDKDQLASVEAGAVLGDLCRHAERGNYTADTAAYIARTTGQQLPAQYLAQGRALPLAQSTVMLRESRRFGGAIGQLALQVNAGHADAAMHLLQQHSSAGPGAPLQVHEGGNMAALLRSAVPPLGWPGAEVATLAHALQQLQDAPAYAPSFADYALALGAGRGAAFAAESDHAAWAKQVLRAFDRYRLLCAVRDGEWGVAGLNRAVEAALAQRDWIRKGGEWYAGRPVMVTRNDVQLGVFNGDIGIALPSFTDPKRLRVYFLQGEHLHHVSTARLAHVETAFAMTVHKSQGSEFAHTALVLSSQGGSVLTRELVYTGITRARSVFSLWSEVPGLLTSAIGSPTQRSSGLLRFLQAPHAHT